jgi:hypothetical protein
MRGLVACLAVCCLALPGAAQTPPVPPGKESKAETPRADAPKTAEPAARPSVDKLKIPPGGVLVLVEEAKGALQFLPKMVLLTPEKFQELMDRISTLERQLKAEKKLPNFCKLTGRLDGDVVRLQAEYRFTTERPGTAIFLGGQGAVISDAKLDGQAPYLDPGDNGYSVQVQKPGEHMLVLSLQVPVTTRATAAAGTGSERGFELGLPGAAVTLLNLELPPPVKELRWNESLEKRPGGSTAGRWSIPIGRVKTLNVSWKEPVNVPGAGALLLADGQILVQIQDTQVVTNADLTLTDLRGQTRDWRVWAPAGSKLEIKLPSGLTCETVAPPSANSPFVLRLSEPTTERFHVLIQGIQARPFARLAVGPFAVLDAYRQQGNITIKASADALRGLKPVYHRQGGVVERDIPKEPAGADVIAAFKYWNMAPSGKSGSASLELELQPVKGAIETQLEHTLRLKPIQEGWQVLAVTRVNARPVRDSVDYLEMQLPRPRPEGLAALGVLPAGFPANVPWGTLPQAAQMNWPVRVPLEYECEGEDSGAELLPAGPNRRAGIKLQQFQSKKFTITLTGTYFLPTGAQAARLELPRPVGTLDRGATITVETDGNQELLPLDGATEAPLAHRHQQLTVWQRTPAVVDMAWRPYRPDLPVRVIADVRVRGQHAHVHQQIHLLPQEGGADSKGRVLPVRLHVPRAVRGLTLLAGGKLQSLDADTQTAWIVPSREGDSLTLDFDFARPASEADKTEPRPFPVPLLWPVAATRAETRVRFWCESGTVPILAGADRLSGRWRDQGAEVVVGHDSLPALVVASDHLDPRLHVTLEDSSQPPLPALVVDRGLIQVVIDEEGTEYYRARFVIDKLNTPELDIAMPAPPTDLMLQVALDHKRLAWRLIETGGKVIRLNVQPYPQAHPVVLDFAYRLSPGQPLGLLPRRCNLSSPLLRNAVLLGQVRWQVSLPNHLIAVVAARDAYVEQSWAWHGWLPAPEPATSAAELEHWLAAGQTTASAAQPSVVCWRTTLSPLTIVRAPRQIWWLACSGLVLLFGLGLSLVPRTRLAFWLLSLLLAAGIVAVALLWPSLSPLLVYGSLPGLLVLGLLLTMQWLLHRQYRRQVVFMPGFTRLKSGSSLVRTAAPPRPREPSTIDAPTVPGAPGQPPSSVVKGT